ncbi:triacylglycerol lipase [Apiospora kogelbergensis]|uniref:triacylglycerol lipase n=1 Tax=Apiospora kogelbergensis TaxID=1337665 RepID=UPI0031323CA1
MLPKFFRLLAFSYVVAAALGPAQAANDQKPLRVAGTNNPASGISTRLFAHLERLSRLVDIAYCVGTTGLSRPFECVSRCKDFPTLELVESWNTGVLMSDSCGYVAVDHGANRKTSALDRGAIIIAFRGTYSITNTVVDLSTVPQEYVPYPSPDGEEDSPPKEPEHRCDNCTVHMGFLASWKIARESVLPTLKPLVARYPDYPIHLVGHSLGGAVAALAALEMKVILGWDNVVVTTFGEPRVGNVGFVRYLDAVFGLKNKHTDAEQYDYRRLTHVDDPVPLLPLSEWGFRSHAGEMFISKSDLSPAPEDIFLCVGDIDPGCIAGSEGEPPSLGATEWDDGASQAERRSWGIPSRLKLWQLLFAHRDYFWRLGLCVPGGDPIDWGRDRYPNVSGSDEL